MMMKKNGFTMIELVMVIVVMGILAALAIPRMQRDLRQEAADNILSAIRYTQHLALNDDKTDPNDNQWQKKYWHLRFGSYGGKISFYTISSNSDGDTNVDEDETAIDPANGKYMYHLAGDATLDESDESHNIFVRNNYTVDGVTFEGGCSNGQLIAFDHLGRPHVGIYSGTNDFSTYMSEDCDMTISFEDTSISDIKITIYKETGYAEIVDQNGS
jgi:prepilin-type N-terminal cleavage/methylation domain-containing protein